MVSQVAQATAAFAATNVDDLILLTTLFTTSGRGGPSRGRITAGQYVGMAVIVAVAGALAAVLLTVPDRWVGLLGLVPIGLGLRGLLAARSSAPAAAAVVAPVAAPVRGVVGVAALTVANGADNVSVYTPLFRQSSPGGVVACVAVFAVLVGLWCLVSASLARRRPLVALLDRTGRWLVPVVFVVIGVGIVVRSGLLGTRL